MLTTAAIKDHLHGHRFPFRLNDAAISGRSLLFPQHIPHDHGVVRELFERVCQFLALLLAPPLRIFLQLRKFFDDQRSTSSIFTSTPPVSCTSLAKSHDLIWWLILCRRVALSRVGRHAKRSETSAGDALFSTSRRRCSTLPLHGVENICSSIVLAKAGFAL